MNTPSRNRRAVGTFGDAHAPMSDKLLTMIAVSSHWLRRRTELRCASRPTGQQCLPVGESSIDVSLRRLAEEYLNFVELAGEDDLVVLRCTRSAG